MLQQTQVSRVIPKFREFMARFPTVEALAAADEDRVLAAWSGLGYYRRARHLHSAARAVVERHGGIFPTRIEELRALPGVGRYTAGSIASIAMGLREPLVDGNVARVLLRIAGREGNIGETETAAWAWSRAERLVHAATDPGAFTEGLMELGAPVSPKCDGCPVASLCRARRAGKQGRIPSAKKRAARRVVYCGAALILDERGRVAVERRGAGVMWAGMWQAPTVEREDRAPTAREVARHVLGSNAGPADLPARLRRVLSIRHGTTHRDVRIDVWVWKVGGASREMLGTRWRGRWISESGIDRLGLSSIQRRILEMAFKNAGPA
jgi:A/G-specific adenine glycosylase